MLKTPLTLALSVIGVSLPPALFFRVQPRSFPAIPLPLPPAPHPPARASSTAQPDQGRLQREVPRPPVSLHVLLTTPSWASCLPSLCPAVPLLSPLAAPRKAEGFPRLCLEKRQAVTRGLLLSFPLLLLPSSSTTSHHLPLPRPRPPSSSFLPIASSSKASLTSYPALLHPPHYHLSSYQTPLIFPMPGLKKTQINADYL